MIYLTELEDAVKEVEFDLRIINKHIVAIQSKIDLKSYDGVRMEINTAKEALGELYDHVGKVEDLEEVPEEEEPSTEYEF